MLLTPVSDTGQCQLKADADVPPIGLERVWQQNRQKAEWLMWVQSESVPPRLAPDAQAAAEQAVARTEEKASNLSVESAPVEQASIDIQAEIEKLQ